MTCAAEHAMDRCLQIDAIQTGNVRRRIASLNDARIGPCEFMLSMSAEPTAYIHLHWIRQHTNRHSRDSNYSVELTTGRLAHDDSLWELLAGAH